VKKISVVKLGGRILEEADLRREALSAVARAWRAGDRFVVVHGGGRQVDAWSLRLGIPKETVEGLRVTDASTIEVVAAVVAGLVNKRLVAEMRTLGIEAAGISGVDAGTLSGSLHPKVGGSDLGFVGRVEACDTTLVKSLLAAGILPLIAPLGVGPGGALLNINADAAASALAAGLGARRLLFLTDVEGVLDGKGRIISRITREEASRLLDSEIVTGGMKPKLTACLEALGRGVREVVIAGRERHSKALFSGTGGTRLVAA
jgi:acetylglutamate kinase